MTRAAGFFQPPLSYSIDHEIISGSQMRERGNEANLSTQSPDFDLELRGDRR